MIDLKHLEELAKKGKRPIPYWYGQFQICDGITDEDAVRFIEAATPYAILELIETQRMLVDALKTIVNEIPSSVEYSDWPEMQEFVEKAILAIQKATGESS